MIKEGKLGPEGYTEECYLDMNEDDDHEFDITKEFFFFIYFIY